MSFNGQSEHLLEKVRRLDGSFYVKTNNLLRLNEIYIDDFDDVEGSSRLQTHLASLGLTIVMVDATRSRYMDFYCC